MPYWVYILASQKNGTLYTGVTGRLAERVHLHKTKYQDGFTKEHDVNRLVYCEEHDDVGVAIYREKCIKKWKRAWKLDLIEKDNPNWNDLYDDMF